MTDRPRREVDDRLADWVDGRLSDRERERFVAEMRVNPQLRQDLEDYERTVGVVRAALRAPTSPSSMADRILAAVAEQRAAPAARRTAWSSRHMFWSLASAAALLACALWVDQWSSPAPLQTSVAAAPDPAAAGVAPSTDAAAMRDGQRQEGDKSAADKPAADKPAADKSAGNRLAGDGQTIEDQARTAEVHRVSEAVQEKLADPGTTMLFGVRPAPEAAVPVVTAAAVVESQDAGAGERRQLPAPAAPMPAVPTTVAPTAGGGGGAAGPASAGPAGPTRAGLAGPADRVPTVPGPLADGVRAPGAPAVAPVKATGAAEGSRAAPVPPPTGGAPVTGQDDFYLGATRRVPVPTTLSAAPDTAAAPVVLAFFAIEAIAADERVTADLEEAEKAERSGGQRGGRGAVPSARTEEMKRQAGSDTKAKGAEAPLDAAALLPAFDRFLAAATAPNGDAAAEQWVTPLGTLQASPWLDAPRETPPAARDKVAERSEAKPEAKKDAPAAAAVERTWLVEGPRQDVVALLGRAAALARARRWDVRQGELPVAASAVPSTIAGANAAVGGEATKPVVEPMRVVLRVRFPPR